jgi:hypothetical protein
MSLILLPSLLFFAVFAAALSGYRSNRNVSLNVRVG